MASGFDSDNRICQPMDEGARLAILLPGAARLEVR